MRLLPELRDCPLVSQPDKRFQNLAAANVHSHSLQPTSLYVERLAGKRDFSFS